MTIGLTEEQAALAEAVAGWAAGRGFPETARAVERGADGVLTAALPGLAGLGVTGIAVPADLGGAGGSLLDLACALEAASRALVPGALLSTAVASVVLAEQAGTPVAKRLLPLLADGTVSVALAAAPASLEVTDGGTRLAGRVPLVRDAGTATHLLLGAGAEAGPDGEAWYVVDATAPGVTVEPGAGPDLSRAVGSVILESVPVSSDDEVVVSGARVEAMVLVLAAAEAAGTARWALDTAVQHALVREQFGRKIGGFQAIKHLCAEMLERAESATAVAWDAARAHEEPDDQLAFAADVAGVVALEAAVRNAQDCIQVLGGIGFTWEHDAHLHLRRALSSRQLLGGTDRFRTRLARRALAGVRRSVHVDLSEHEDLRARVQDDVARIAAVEGSGRRTALADSGLLAPHWPAPYGRGAGPVEQLLIDEELSAAGVRRPDLAIGAWALPTIIAHGDDAQRERFVRPTLRGELQWCQLFSEPGAGSDLAGLRTRAERVDGGWRLTGQKVWTSLAKEADWAICLARTNPDAPKHKGITYFLVDMASPGIDVRPLREITGDALFNEVFLDGVVVPDACVVGEVDGGWKLARTTLANERVAMSGSSLGANVERALETVASRETPQGSELLRLGGSVADSVTVTMLGLRSTLRALAGHGPGPESSVQKLVGVRHRQESAELAYELLGPEAVLGGDDARAALHEALLTRCLSIAGGTTQVLRNVAGERILGLPRD